MRVFISHSAADAGFAAEVRATVERQGLEAWEMSDAIKGGERWERRILDGLESCDAMLVILSEAAAASRWVYREIAIADDIHKRIIPLRIDGVLPSAVHAAFAGVQHIDLREDAAVWQAALLDAIGQEGRGGARALDTPPKIPQTPDGVPDYDRAGLDREQGPGFHHWLKTRRAVLLPGVILVGGLAALLLFGAFAADPDDHTSADSPGAIGSALRLTLEAEPNRVDAGDEVTFLATVKNTTDAALGQLQLSIAYAEGVEPTTPDSAALGTMQPHSLRNVRFHGIAHQPGTFTAVARVAGNGVTFCESSSTFSVVKCRLSMELAGPPSIYLGETANFTLQLKNVGDGTARGCVVHVRYEGGLSEGQESLSVGPLEPGEDWHHELNRVASAIGPCLLRCESDCSATCTIRDDIELRVTGHAAIDFSSQEFAVSTWRRAVGERFKISLNLANPGAAVFTGIVIALALPPELDFVRGVIDEGEFLVAEGGPSSPEFALRPGVARAVNLELEVKSASPSGVAQAVVRVLRVSDQFEICAGGPLIAIGGDGEQLPLAFHYSLADLMQDGEEAGVFVVGDVFLCRAVLRAKNGSPLTPKLRWACTLPPELEFVSGDASRGVAITGDGQSCTSSDFAVQSGEQQEFTILVRCNSSPPSGLVETETRIYLAKSGLEVARFSESTTLRR